MNTKERCPICDRELGAVNVTEHHLIPKTFKGKEKIPLHNICHQKLHATFSEREMLRWYHTVERMREHLEIQKFIKWISKKDIAFYDTNKETKDRYSKRRR